MPANSWPENDSSKDLDDLEPLSWFLSNFSSEADLEGSSSYRGYEGRRRKAAALLAATWTGTIALHLVSWGSWLVLAVTALVGIHLSRVYLTRPLSFANARET